MNIYLSHNFAAAEYLRNEVAPMLNSAGHTIVSRWLFLHPPYPGPGECAVMDLIDLEHSNCLILFSDQFGDCPGLGKFVEFGYALHVAWKITRDYHKIIIIGETESVFFELNGIVRVDTVEEAILHLTPDWTFQSKAERKA